VTIDRGRFSCPKSLTSCFSCFPSPAVPKKGGCESYHPDDAVRHPPYRHQSFEMGGCESCVRPRCHRQSSIVTLLSSALSLCCHRHFLSSSCHSVTFSSLSRSSLFSSFVIVCKSSVILAASCAPILIHRSSAGNHHVSLDGEKGTVII